MNLNRFQGVLISAVALLFFTTTCKKDLRDQPSTPPPVVNINSSVSGLVVDDNREPVVGAKITVGGSTTQTDAEGKFSVNNFLSGKTTNAFVRIEKDDFFVTGRTLAVFPGSQDFVVVQMVRKNFIGGFSTYSGGSFRTGNGYIEFRSGNLIDVASQKPYAGQVTVACAFIDPTLPDFADQVPGGLRGIDSANAEQGLISYGMLSIELSGNSRQKLQLSPGMTATITMNIPAALTASAPASIPLWHFDDSTGFWKQEGSARRSGSSYVGNVSHFSTWNCDVPVPSTTVEGILTTKDGVILPNRKIAVLSKSTGTVTGFAYTDATGYFSILVLRNAELQLVSYNDCGEEIFSSQIGPVTGSINLGKLTAGNGSEASLTVSGTAMDCSGQLLKKGLVSIRLGNRVYKTPVTDGLFSTRVSRCGVKLVSVTAIDQDKNLQSSPWQSTVNDSIIVTGSLEVCQSVDSFVSYILGGVTKYYTGKQMGTNGSLATGYYIGAGDGQGESISFGFNTPYYAPAGGPPTAWHDASFNTPPNLHYRDLIGGDKIVTITEFGGPGGYISGNLRIFFISNPGNRPGGPSYISFRFKRKD